MRKKLLFIWLVLHIGHLTCNIKKPSISWKQIARQKKKKVKWQQGNMVKDKYKEIRFREASYSNRIWKPDRPGSNLSSTNYSWPSVSTVVEHKDTKGQQWHLRVFGFWYPQWALEPIRCGYQGMTRLTVISGKLFHLFNLVSSSAK